MKHLLFLSAIFFLIFQACTSTAVKHDPMAKASREDKNGWIFVHLEGSPHDIGYQHGFLLANEIDTTLHSVAFMLKHDVNKDWAFFRDCARQFMWDKLDREYKDEINGIVEGLKAKNHHLDSLDITAYNAFLELGYYYVPQLMDAAKPGSGDNKAPGNCSAFIATGSYTKDGKIVMGHNAWIGYVIGQHWNIVADLVPEKGNHILMDCLPGLIHSGDDFLITSNGLMITETTITQFKGFEPSGIPEFVRARKAAQYANSIDDVVRIFTTGNNGGYANDWLIGDTKTNEVAKLELGLKYNRVWRSKDTAMIGSNFASDPDLLAHETTFEVDNPTSSPNARKKRMEQLINVDLKGKLDAEIGKQVEADHVDALQGKSAKNRCVICGHIDEDPLGCKEFDCPAFFPEGSVQGKVTTSALAANMQFWARMGHPCGDDFIGATFYKAHPEYSWMSKYLNDMKSYPWTLFGAKK
jgi:hypothetical protein